MYETKSRAGLSLQLTQTCPFVSRRRNWLKVRLAERECYFTAIVSISYAELQFVPRVITSISVHNYKVVPNK